MNVKQFNIGYKDILYFKKPDFKISGRFNFLKNFTTFLKLSGKKGPFKFTSANEDNSLHAKLNIKQNILLETIPDNFNGLNESNFEEYTKGIENKYLAKLIKRIYPLDRLPFQLNAEERKIAILVKSMLNPCDYVFLDSPDKNLNDGNLSILKQCLIYESCVMHKAIFITSDDDSIWNDMVTQIVYLDAAGNFDVQANKQSNNEVLRFIDKLERTNTSQWQTNNSSKKAS